MKKLVLAALAASICQVQTAVAQESEIEIAKEFFSTAGVPAGRWVEGESMQPHVAPAKHFNATLLY